MIILAAAIILALNSSNITNKAKWAKLSSDRANLQAEYVTVLAKAMSDKVDGKAYMVKVSELKETPEYKAWAQKVTDAGFTVEEPEDDNDPAAIRVVAKLSEAQLIAYGLEYDEANNEVVGYNWVVNKDAKIVKIPEGFVKSIYPGETTVAEGLVIYETDSLEGIDQETAMTSFNQFVWVPVNDFSKFERTTTYDGTITAPFSNYTEPYTELSLANDRTGEWAEYTTMRASVQENKGFYIGRYEAGTSSQRTNEANGTSFKADGTTPDVLSQKDKYPYDFVGWGPSETSASGDVIWNSKNQGKGAVELSRSMYEDSTSVVSTLCYGVQWDSALQFIYNTDNTYPTNSINKGNYEDGTQNTGSSDDYAVNNIYDMAGNVDEWTMEGTYASGYGGRIVRGGYSMDAVLGVTYSAGHREPYDAYLTDNGFRVALYLI